MNEQDVSFLGLKGVYNAVLVVLLLAVEMASRYRWALIRNNHILTLHDVIAKAISRARAFSMREVLNFHLDQSVVHILPASAKTRKPRANYP